MAEKSTVKLTGRDVTLLVDLYKMRYLTVAQIQRLHFPSEQTTYRRLRLLRSTGHVQMFSAPNIESSIVHLDKAGAELVAAHLQSDLGDLGWKEISRTPKDYYFLSHFLAINDFRIALRQGCAGTSVNLLGFIPESYGEKTSKGGVTKYIRDVVCDIKNKRDTIGHTPDAVFALERESKSALFFLEVDRGTESVSDAEKGVLKCVRFYLNYLADGKYQRYAKDFGCVEFKGFRALIVTTADQRLRNCREAAKLLDFPAQGKRFIWVSTYERIQKYGPLGPIWQSLDAGDDKVYKIG
jgi:hypothetical protein